MRVLFLDQFFPPDSAAVAYLLGQLCEDLSEHHEVWVLAGKPSYSPETNTYRPHGVNVRRAWSTVHDRSNMLGRLTNYGTYLSSSLLRSMALPRPDVVVALTDPPVIGLIGLVAARRHKSAFVQVYQDVYPDIMMALGRMKNPFLISIWRRLNRFVRERADRIVVVGRDMADKLEGEGVPAHKICVIPNWADSGVFEPRQVDEVRAAMGWDGRFVIMHAGNVGLAQNLDRVLDAAERLGDEPDLAIVFLGEGASKARLQELARQRRLSNVEFLDSVPKEQAQLIARAVDLHIVSLAPGLLGCAVPSKMYGILEAGKPFVAAVEAGSEVARTIDEYRCGVRVDPGDAEQLADAIVHIRSHPDPTMGERGRAAFENTFSRDVATTAYRELLESLSGNGSGSGALAG
jgi:colanic acid biosynthesis glycosyl transferase WcaI